MSLMNHSGDESPIAGKKSRKSHKKSRAGCRNCKKRRIKCDETKPDCTNCIQFKIHCDFNPRPAPILESSSSPSPSAPVRRRRGRPRKGWDRVTTPTMSSGASTPTTEYASSFSGPTSEPILDVSDLELMHHYSTVTCHDLGDGSIGIMWQINVPKLGFTMDNVLHNTMALSAMHLAYLRPDRREHYAVLAAHHSTIGLRKTSEVLDHLDESNCQSLYISAVLVCLYVFAKGPTPGEYLVFGEHGEPEWLPLLQGVRTIIETFGHRVLWSGLLSPMRAGPRTALQPSAVKQMKPRIDWEKPFEDLRQFIAFSGHVDLATYTCALTGLEGSYEACYGKGPHGSFEGDTASQVVLGWFYRLDQNFILCLRHKHPLALLILAYFTPLLKSMEPLWFMMGWADHIITGIRGFIDESVWDWLRWPAEQVQLQSSPAGITF